MQDKTMQDKIESDKIETYVCRRMRVLTYLQSRGYNFYKCVPDKENPDFDVWLFTKTPDLMQAVEDYYSSNGFKNK